MARYLSLLFVLLAHPFVAQADAFKCVDGKGHVTFAQVPCPPEKGTTAWAASTARTELVSANPEDAEPQRINEKATQILRSGYNVKYKYKVVLVPRTEPPVKATWPKPKPAYQACNSAANARYCNQ